MSLRKILSILLLLGVIAGLTVTAWAWARNKGFGSIPSPQEALKIDKDTASRIADEVLQKVNPMSRITEMELVEERPHSKKLVWQARWGPSGTDGQIWIDVLDGKVKFFCDLKKAENATASRKPPLPQEAALAEALKRAAGLGFLIPQSPPSEAQLLREEKKWFFKWPREMNGYRFHDDSVFIFVDATQGEIISYRNLQFSLDPPSLEVEIEKTRALESAEKIAVELGFSLDSEKAALMIVNPNFRWTETFVKYPVEAKLAWVIPFTKPEGKGEIWIDSVTGRLLGGEESR